MGVRRALMQCRAHDDDDGRAAPAVAPAAVVGPKIPMASAFQRPPPEQSVFQGWGVAGIVESWPKTLVPSAPSLSTPAWSPVDSVDPCQRRARPSADAISGTCARG